MSTVDGKELKGIIDGILHETASHILETVPGASHLIDQEDLRPAYYIRHRVETVKRIQLTSRIDALALARMVKEDYGAARQWARYIAEELNHDLLYLRDLRRHGYTNAMVDAIKPFPATTDLVAFLAKELDRIGSLAAVAYSIWAEWNSERASGRVVEKAEAAFSSTHVSGSRTHLGIDESEDHYGVMLNIAHRLLAEHGDVDVLLGLLRSISGFFSQYFSQLFEETITSPVPAG